MRRKGRENGDLGAPGKCLNPQTLLYKPWWHIKGASGISKNFILVGGGSNLQLRTEFRQNGDLGAVTP
jgi:hypothetical protein